jgi:hypothetical protein
MTDYSAIIETETDPGAPSKSTLWKRFWKNPLAMFEGAIGAPRLQFAAMDTWFTTAGGVGTYVFARGGADAAFGATVAGSTLAPTTAPYMVPSSSGSATFTSGSALSGTWRCMGNFDYTTNFTGGAAIYGATLWMRIA